MTPYILINGYGAPEDPVSDPNLNSYLWQAIGIIRRVAEGSQSNVTVILMGPTSNRTDLSEAEALKTWFDAHRSLLPTNVEFVRVEGPDGCAARENLEFAREQFNDVPVVLLCEWTRQLYMRYFARRLYSTAQVEGIPFDRNSFRPRELFKRVAQTLLEIGACHFKWLDRIRKRKRAAHVAAARLAYRRAHLHS